MDADALKVLRIVSNRVSKAVGPSNKAAQAKWGAARMAVFQAQLGSSDLPPELSLAAQYLSDGIESAKSALEQLASAIRAQTGPGNIASAWTEAGQLLIEAQMELNANPCDPPPTAPRDSAEQPGQRMKRTHRGVASRRKRLPGVL
ncbi:MAG TPA: hypothetical protein VF984_14235 [Actinomycetota bacterium]